jgi:hypothetical protein
MSLAIFSPVEVLSKPRTPKAGIATAIIPKENLLTKEPLCPSQILDLFDEFEVGGPERALVFDPRTSHF